MTDFLHNACTYHKQTSKTQILDHLGVSKSQAPEKLMPQDPVGVLKTQT